MNRFYVIVVLACCSFFARANVVTADEPKPNIIFILADDLGWGDLGVFYQNDSKHDRKLRTPMLDQMAAGGMQMRAHYCPAPVCAPSRATLLTGVHQGHAVIRDNQFDKMLEDNHTLATVLKTAGYKTALIGKWGLQGGGKTATGAKNWPGFPTNRGFDEFYGYVRHRDGHVHYPAHDWELGNSESHRTPKELFHNDKEVSGDIEKCYTTDLFTARSKHWIAEHRQQNPEQPFFLYLAYDTPHAALQVPTVEYPEGQGLKGGLQWIGRPGNMINTAVGEIDSYRHPDYVGKGWEDQEERHATMVRRIDDCVGDLLKTLSDLGIAENTMVVFTSDNGPHHESYLHKVIKGAGENGTDKRVNVDYDPTSFQSYGIYDGTKRDVWEAGIRMPTLAWWPGKIKAGAIDNHPSQFHDWMATLADIAGTVAPARCDGVSLTPTLSGVGEQQSGTVYVEYLQNGRTRDYKDFSQKRRNQKRKQMQAIFLEGFMGVRTNIEAHSDPFEIYDVTNDPKQTIDLAGSSSDFESLQNRMHDRVLQLRRANDSAKRPYDREFVPAVKDRVAETQGLNWRIFKGPFPFVPNTNELEPNLSGTSDDFSAAGVDLKTADAIDFSGFLNVTVAGEYEFSIGGNERAFVRIHDIALIDADFEWEDSKSRRSKVRLAVGMHPIKVTGLLATDAKSIGLALKWSIDGKPMELVPPTALGR